MLTSLPASCVCEWRWRGSSAPAAAGPEPCSAARSSQRWLPAQHHSCYTTTSKDAPPPHPFFSHLATSLWQKNTMKNKHKNSNYTQTTRIHVRNRRESFISLKNTRITHAVCQLFVYLAATQCLTLQYSGQANYIKIKKQTTYFAVCFSHTWLWNRVNTVNVVWTGSPKQGYNNAKFDRPWLNSIWEKAHSTVKSENVNDLPRDQIYIVRENHNKDFDISGHSTDLPSTNRYINFFFFILCKSKKRP